MIGLTRRVLFLIGIILAGLAFLATGAEMAAFAINPHLGLMPSADQVWRTLSPDSYVAALSRPWLATLAGLKIFSLPGWLVLGGPGLILIITCRTRGDDPSPELEQSLFLFDELAQRAHEEGFMETDADIATNNHPDFLPADKSYAQDNIVDDLLGQHDFLLDDANADARPDDKVPSDA